MAQKEEHYSLEKIQALQAYFLHMRNSSRGKPEYSDLDTTVKLCEQLLALMQKHNGRQS